MGAFGELLQQYFGGTNHDLSKQKKIKVVKKIKSNGKKSNRNRTVGDRK